MVPANTIVKAELLLKYVYLDTEERRKFAQESHEYLMNGCYYNSIVWTDANQKMETITRYPKQEKLAQLEEEQLKEITEHYQNMSKAEQLLERFGIDYDDLSEGHARARNGKIYHTHQETGETYMWCLFKKWWTRVGNEDDDDEETPAKIVTKELKTFVPDKGTREFYVNLTGLYHPCSVLIFSLHHDDSCESAFKGLDDLIYYRLLGNNVVLTEGNRDAAFKLNKLDSKILCSKNVATYIISFSLDPFDPVQPSGTLNFSRLDNVVLHLKITNRVGCVRVWGIHNNVLRIMSGMAGLGFAN
jgi:hypothetical protein